MHYTVQWRVEGRVAHVQIDGPAEGGLSELDYLLVDILDHAQTPVHFVFECHVNSRGGLSVRLGDITAMQTRRHPRLGWVMLTGNLDPVARSLAVLAARLNRTRLRIVDSTDQGLQRLTRLDPSLPPVAAPNEA